MKLCNNSIDPNLNWKYQYELMNYFSFKEKKIFPSFIHGKGLKIKTITNKVTLYKLDCGP